MSVIGLGEIVDEESRNGGMCKSLIDGVMN